MGYIFNIFGLKKGKNQKTVYDLAIRFTMPAICQVIPCRELLK